MTDLTTIDNALGDDMRIIGSLVVVLCILAVAGTPASEALQDDAAAEFAGKCAMCWRSSGVASRPSRPGSCPWAPCICSRGRRAAAWEAPEPPATRGVLGKYVRTVSSASLGCITDG